MNLQVVTPTRTIIDEPVQRITVQGADGSRTFLPRHIDFVTALVPSVMSWHAPEGEEKFAAIDGGIVVKTGDDVMVSTSYAIHGPELGRLRQMVDDEFEERSEHEKVTRSALARLEAGIVRRFMELGD